MVQPMPSDKDLTLVDKDNSELLQDAGMYVFMDDVSSETIKPIIEWILVENHVTKKRKKELLLMICSDGGSIGDAFALIDVMKSSTIPIKTVGLGSIASCGLLIFMAGARGSRILTPNTSILSHQYSWGSDGKAHELFSITKEFNLTQARMVEHYKESTGLSEEQIRQTLLPPSDVWLTAQEALDLGICDYISDLKKK
ncbi:ClpP Protease subunit of ATP-dependent Clp proteases [uncultured Caudovirales phage]|uniref:ClpP Protease subunit of ATP-dependent Clp proteases n=1 Tax=uncultured Caudovirales phage TaxID=2100421 RepID=A0A6J5LUV3_9CAUD|nr:ClpP Protease subunit of ATP-dependent Clp proteases [uncultured Caudovirales phage]